AASDQIVSYICDKSVLFNYFPIVDDDRVTPHITMFFKKIYEFDSSNVQLHVTQRGVV
ncbi:hypothetical protein C0J52_04953, partial [Blattella germanica]